MLPSNSSRSWGLDYDNYKYRWAAWPVQGLGSSVQGIVVHQAFSFGCYGHHSGSFYKQKWTPFKSLSSRLLRIHEDVSSSFSIYSYLCLIDYYWRAKPFYTSRNWSKLHFLSAGFDVHFTELVQNLYFCFVELYSVHSLVKAFSRKLGLVFLLRARYLE